ncbi:hypothetical protein [Pantoea sp.]|uniref:hypothetical protein n=1 Tax=Pantoea sp. TaxID=69393 RepID=UPI00289FF716|nr:hypothetical protein [Pantoea sp.]
MLKIKLATLSTRNEAKNFFRMSTVDVQVKAAMHSILASGLKETPLSKQISECYPWCFLLADRNKITKKVFLGTIATLHDDTGREVFVSYISLNVGIVKKHLASLKNLAFWQARILAMLLDNNTCEFNNKLWQEWKVSLQRSLFPLWEKYLLKSEFRFDRKKNILLSPCCKTDLDLPPDVGVDVMPWKGWPDITLNENELWLWRQNWQARIIDCQKVAFQ